MRSYFSFSGSSLQLPPMYFILWLTFFPEAFFELTFLIDGEGSRPVPVKFIEAGVKRSDLRNLVESQLSMEGKESQEIRGREVGVRAVKSGDFRLISREYKASKK